MFKAGGSITIGDIFERSISRDTIKERKIGVGTRLGRVSVGGKDMRRGTNRREVEQDAGE